MPNIPDRIEIHIEKTTNGQLIHADLDRLTALEKEAFAIGAALVVFDERVYNKLRDECTIGQEGKRYDGTDIGKTIKRHLVYELEK